MKKVWFSIALIFLAAIVYGQATEGTVQYQKADQPAAVIELPYSPDVVRDAMRDYLSKKGKSKGDDRKGFTTYRNTQALQSDSANADLYFKVERKSRQEKEISVVSLLLTTPEGGSSQNLHYLQMDQAKTYLNDLAPAIEAYQLELQIKEQNEKVIRAEAKYKGLTDDGTDLEKKRVEIEKKLADNKQDVQKQAAEVEAQKQRLSQLVEQRKA